MLGDLNGVASRRAVRRGDLRARPRRVARRLVLGAADARASGARASCRRSRPARRRPDRGLTRYAELIADALGDADDVIVVGHSLGAGSIPIVATLRPIGISSSSAGCSPSPARASPTATRPRRSSCRASPGTPSRSRTAPPPGPTAMPPSAASSTTAPRRMPTGRSRGYGRSRRPHDRAVAARRDPGRGAHLDPLSRRALPPSRLVAPDVPRAPRRRGGRARRRPLAVPLAPARPGGRAAPRRGQSVRGFSLSPGSHPDDETRDRG